MVSGDIVAGGSEKRYAFRIRRKTDNVQLHELTVFDVEIDFGTLYFQSLCMTSLQRIIRSQKMCRIHKIGISIYSFITSTKTT